MPTWRCSCLRREAKVSANLSVASRVGATLDVSFFARDPAICAKELVGCAFRWRGVGGIIVETEAYAAEGDEACHTFFRPSARTFVAQHSVGDCYIYLNYGVHWLVNVLTKSDDGGNGFVLLRAMHPKWGVASMRERRRRDMLTDLCSGPGKLSQALGLTGLQHGNPISSYFQCGQTDRPEVIAGPRIGISRAKSRPWRFVMAGDPHVSRGGR